MDPEATEHRDGRDQGDVPVHSTASLSQALGEDIVERRRLHAWPLSSVELLRTATGERWVYKAALEPSLEHEFYTSVSSPFLPAWRPLERTETWTAMLFEFVDLPLLRNLDLSDAELADHARRAVAAIAEVPSDDVATYADFGSVPRWHAFVDDVLDLLAELIASGRFTIHVAPETYDEVHRWSRSAGVHRLVNETSGLLHGDLNPGNIFVGTDHDRIIDWQRPLIGPRDLDVAACLEGRPSLFDHVQPAAIGVFAAVRLHWSVMSTTHYLPDLRVVLGAWASQALDLIVRSAALGEP